MRVCGQDITSLERLKRSDVERQRRIVGSLIVYSVLIYISGALLLYFYFMPTLWFDRFLYCLPLIVFPLLWVCSLCHILTVRCETNSNCHVTWTFRVSWNVTWRERLVCRETSRHVTWTSRVSWNVTSRDVNVSCVVKRHVTWHARLVCRETSRDRDVNVLCVVTVTWRGRLVCREPSQVRGSCAYCCLSPLVKYIQQFLNKYGQ